MAPYVQAHRFQLKRKGFSLIELIVAMAIVSALLVVIMRVTVPETQNDRARVDAVTDGLAGLAKAISGREASRAPTSFREVIGAHPSKLSQLTKQIVAGVDRNICNATYSSSAVPTKPIPPGYALAWTKPFYYRQLSPSGTILAPGFTLQDAIVLIGPTPSATLGSNGATTIALRFPSVILRDAEALDLSVDGSTDGTAGTIRYNSAVDPTQVDYYINITGC